MLYDIIIGPVETIVDWVFYFIINNIPQAGVIGAVIGVSLTINYLALPLYNIADALQEKERKIAKLLEYRVNKIKKAFKGDERFMMLSVYYRQNNYHPLYALRSSLSILIEIPFFIAAYHYLSHCEALRNVSFWIFKDLGRPDGLLTIHIFGRCLPVHILPILMTLINFVSGAIYTRNASFREKIQQYGIAGIFLVLLYKSPSGLVLYWILNNWFSLLKNMVNTTKYPAKIAHASLIAIFAFGSAWYLFSNGVVWRKIFVILFTIFVVLFPRIVKLLKLYYNKNKISLMANDSLNFYIVLLSGLSVALLAGYLLPAYIFIHYPQYFVFNPKLYLFNAFPTALGFFVFWPVCIYKLFGKSVKISMALLFFVIFACSLVNVLVLHTDFSLLTLTFDYERTAETFSLRSVLLPIFVFAASIFVFSLFCKLKKPAVPCLLLAACLVTEIVFCARYTFYLKKTDYEPSVKNACNYLNSFEPEAIVLMRKRSLVQLKNFVLLQTLPPVLRVSFFFNCSEKFEIKSDNAERSRS